MRRKTTMKRNKIDATVAVVRERERGAPEGA